MINDCLIFGVNGQDGSWLAELLLEKGYQVHGIMRRSSTDTTENIEHLMHHPNFDLIEGDVTDATGVHRIVDRLQPKEIYNLAAMSHVGVSFDQPVSTFEIDAIGPLNILEAIRQSSTKSKFYQASTSELFGDTDLVPQNEETPMRPCSPYAIAKLAAHNSVALYRQAYGLFACAGILFNHECISLNTPLLVKQDGFIDIIQARDLGFFREDGTKSQTFEVNSTDVWDKNGWTKIKCATVTKTKEDNSDHKMLCVNSRRGSFVSTAHHKALDNNEQDVRVDQLRAGDKVSLIHSFPDRKDNMLILPEFAELLGYLAGDGYINIGGGIQFTNNDQTLRDRVSFLWQKLYGGKCRTVESISGFGGTSTQLYLNGSTKEQRIILRNLLYTKDKKKKVPKNVLNCPDVWKNFVDSYYDCDGLKSSVTRCRYKYQSFKSNSPILAAGLIYMINQLTEQSFNINSYLNRDILTYCVNFHSPNDTNKGSHWLKEPNEITKIFALPREKYVVDIETESGTFNCGVGMSHVHNSERRGNKFVTRKITGYVASLMRSIEKSGSIPVKGVDVLPLYLGNLDAKRDWSHAKDMVYGMWLMLQQDEPSDFVLASGKTRTVREFLVAAFSVADLNYEDYVEIDPKFYRPADVNLLLGDPTRAREILGWTQEISFDDLVSRMVMHDVVHGKNDICLA